ncbi:hypothetical protein BH11PSE8_BH11PSE8_46550 [soil metagenome]
MLLFRAAVQPVLGLGWASAIFALAHIRTAALAGRTLRKVAYPAPVLVAGLALGLVYRHVGLWAAILIHATIDVISLSALQRLKQSSPLEPSAAVH